MINNVNNSYKINNKVNKDR